MKLFKSFALVAALLASTTFNVQAAEVCKVSMMGRVCFEEGSAEATSSHMKGDAVAEAAAQKKKAADDVTPKKLADNSAK